MRFVQGPRENRIRMSFMKSRGHRAALVAMVLCSAAIVLPAQQPAVQPSKRDAALQTPPAGPVRVIISTRPGAAAGVADKLRQRGRSDVRRFSLVDAVASEVTPEDLDSLDADPAVIGLSIDAIVAAGGAAGPAGLSECGPLQATLSAPVQGLSGKGVGVAIIDSGLQPGGDFSGVSFFDFTGEAAGGPYDDYGHGTHVAGLVASKGTLSQQACPGVAPRVRLVSLKVLDSEGRGATSAVIAALEFATEHKGDLGIDVINLSLGHPIYEPRHRPARTRRPSWR
jgi:serine protease AprX